MVFVNWPHRNEAQQGQPCQKVECKKDKDDLQKTLHGLKDQLEKERSACSKVRQQFMKVEELNAQFSLELQEKNKEIEKKQQEHTQTRQELERVAQEVER